MKICRKSSIRLTLFPFSFLPKESQNLVFFKVSHMQEQGCFDRLETTGINNLCPTKQEPGKAAWVVFCTSAYELGCFNALLMPQEPIEAGTDYTEKEVNKLFTTQQGCSVSSLHRLEGSESIGHWAADGKGSLELPSSGCRNVCGASITGNHMCCHYQLLSETDATRSILVSDIKELLWLYTDFWTKANNKTILNY